jgi:molybdopterin-guanine dinucleotide biosynthesis protein MobB
VIVTISGATTAAVNNAVTCLIRGFSERGRKIAVVAASGDTLDVDQPGKDSHAHVAAGAREVFVISKPRWARVHGGPAPASQSLARSAALVPNADIVLAIGFSERSTPHLVVEDSVEPSACLVVGSGENPGFRLDKPGPIADLIGRLSKETS